MSPSITLVRLNNKSTIHAAPRSDSYIEGKSFTGMIFIRDKLIIIRPVYLLFYWIHNIYNLFCTLQNKIALIINEEVYGFTDFRKTRVGNWRQSRIR